ncbi:RDD family protein [Novosphingobium sp. BL-8A]
MRAPFYWAMPSSKAFGFLRNYGWLRSHDRALLCASIFSKGETVVPFGGFWWRVLAYVIDSVILSIATTMIAAMFNVSTASTNAQDGYGMAILSGYLFFFSITTVLQWLYFAGLESSPWQGTIGKLAVGLVVTDLHGNRISFLRATGRYFAKILSGMILLIGYIMVGFTERKQGLHDIIASTLVFKTRDPREAKYVDENVFA